MTKRLLALFLVCILAIPILAFPASATSTQEVTLSDADIGFFDDWYSYIDEGIGVCGDYLSQLLYQVKSFVIVTVPAWTTKFNELVTADELGEWLGTMGADMRDGLFVIGTACVDIYEYLVKQIFGVLEIIEETVIDFASLVDSWFEVIYTRLTTISTMISKLVGGDTPEAEDFNNQISTEATEFDEAVDNMTEATLPDYESIDTDFGDYLYNDGFIHVSGFYAAFFSGNVLYYVLMLAATFALLSYSIFGKR